jgi:hypothetical protein
MAYKIRVTIITVIIIITIIIIIIHSDLKYHQRHEIVLCFKTLRRVLGPIQPPLQWGPEFLPEGKAVGA